MRTACLALVSTVLLTVAVPGMAGSLGAPAATAPAKAVEKQVDALFAKWNRRDTPGAAVVVVRDGKVLFQRGYGMADLEHNAPISTSTAFHVASMSKQFTAFAIHLLAQDGKLSLDDDIRKYLPEVPDFGKTITIRHLVHHTSGLRDQWNLLALAGWRLEDVITEEDILGLIQRQRALNFAPGAEHVYSNTGYTLLGLIVKRVSGKPLAAFASERIFEPLGMRHTFFHENYGTLVPGRSASYEPLPNGGYRYIALSYSTVGATSLFTTANDLTLWDRNFYEGRIGGKDLLAQIHAAGQLNSGKAIDYASGLVLGKYRGLKTVEHGGADAGYRSQLLRFPDQHFSVAVLANAADVNAGGLARQVAAVYLDQELEPLPAAGSAAKPALVEVPIDPARLDALVGEFQLSPELVIKFTKEDGHLMGQLTGQPKFQLYPTNERKFFLKVVDAQFSFDAPGKDGIIAGGVLHQNGRDMATRRIVRSGNADSDRKDFEGLFYSEELNVLYTLAIKDSKMTLSYPRGNLVLDPVTANTFAAPFPIGRIEFQCSAGAGCSGFSLSNGRVRKLQFSKVAIVAPGAPMSAASGVFLPKSPASGAAAMTASVAAPAP
jgi:CubicO group peptidase (beta-lactamase class C family)